jgi:enoyl-[acyl-carrier protein] reductase II
VLGAEGAQIGSKFVCSDEASSHLAFKQAVVQAREGDTMLAMKKTVPVRLLKNKFYEDVKAAELRGATEDELKQLLGRGRAKRGMFEGDMDEGELEIGQSAYLINTIQPAADIVAELVTEYEQALGQLRVKS